MAEKHERSNFQVNELGDCLVGVDGTLCSELRLSLSIAEELPENTTMCFLYDMCRVETRVRRNMFLHWFIYFHILYFRNKKRGS